MPARRSTLHGEVFPRIALAVLSILLAGAVVLPGGVNHAGDEGDFEGEARQVSLSRSRPAASLAAASPAPGAPAVAGCPQTVLPSNGSTSVNARAPHGGFLYARSVWLITAAEAAANGLAAGTAPTAVGFRYATAPTGPATGSLTVYLENTTHTTNSKAETWAAAITGMTVVHNASTTLPATTAPFDIPFSGGSSFTYTGGGLYVAFDWRRTGAATGGTVVACNTELLSGFGGLKGAQSNTSIPATIAPSSFRPETRFSVGVTNDASVDYVISYGSVAQTLVGPQTVQAVITNRGVDALSNIAVTFDLSGAQSLSSTQIIAGPLQACGGRTTVTFDPFTPSAIGSNSARISVPADDNPTNDVKTRPLDATYNLYSYKHPGTTAAGGVGFSGVTGALVGRFTTVVAARISAVDLEFFAASATAYRVAIYPESTPGSGVPGATPLYEDAADRAVVSAGPVSLELPSLPVVGPGTFFVGLHQTNTVNVNLSFDPETPVRSGSFFAADPWPVALAADWFEFAAAGTNFKPNLGVTLIQCSTAADCADGDACTADACTSQVCLYPAVDSDDGNICTDDSCDPFTGVQHVNNTAVCDDGDACTTADACAAGACSGTAITAPPETAALRWANRVTVNWNAAAFATSYDVVRGSLGALPVGPAGGDEVCFGNLGETSLGDLTLPTSGTGFWYLSRGENGCGAGTYGTQGVRGLPGATRITTTCP